jgi:hypothetical protein
MRITKNIQSQQAAINACSMCLPCLRTQWPLHIRLVLEMCSWGMCIERQERQAIILVELLESRYLPRGRFLIKNKQCDECFLPCHIQVVWGCCAMKIGWLTWTCAMKIWGINHCWCDVHGCHWFFKMPMDLLFGDISMYPHHTKNRQCHNTI